MGALSVVERGFCSACKVRDEVARHPRLTPFVGGRGKEGTWKDGDWLRFFRRRRFVVYVVGPSERAMIRRRGFGAATGTIVAPPAALPAKGDEAASTSSPPEQSVHLPVLSLPPEY